MLVLPFGLEWGISLARVYQFFSGVQETLTGFPLRQSLAHGSILISWPGLRMEFSPEEKLVAIEYAWGLLPLRVRLTYRNLCEARFLYKSVMPPAAVVSPNDNHSPILSKSNQIAAVPPQVIQSSPASGIRSSGNSGNNGALVSTTVTRSDAHGSKQPPTYVLALLELRESRCSLRYTEIAMKLTNKGYKITIESVLGSMSGFYSTQRGKAVLTRVGKGEYELKSDWESLCDPELRQEMLAVRRYAGAPGAPPTFTGVSSAPSPASAPVSTSSRKRASAGAPLNQPMNADSTTLPEEVTVGPATFQRVFLQKLAYSQAPFYQLAYEILKEAAVPLHYRDIAATLVAAGRNVHQDTIMGSLNGYVNTGRALLQRVGKGTYALRVMPIIAPGDEKMDGESANKKAKTLAPPVNYPMLASGLVVEETEMPTFLEVYYLFKERVAGYEEGFTLRELSAILAERGTVITTERLNSRLSAYTSYRRKKNLPQLFDRRQGRFMLSAYGKRVMADKNVESDFVRSVYSRGK